MSYCALINVKTGSSSLGHFKGIRLFDLVIVFLISFLKVLFYDFKRPLLNYGFKGKNNKKPANQGRKCTLKS
jgi:hypothetical protein